MSVRRQSFYVALVGLLGLASAMGIGRFAFTPILPLMQGAGEISLVQGSWLASINYLGYLVGALCCIWMPPKPAAWAKHGLLTVALVTLFMAVPGQGLALWMLWRLLAGIASALVLVGLSAWCLGRLFELNHSHLAGWVYAGVGVGVAVAGLAGLGAGIQHLPPQWLWGVLGIGALLVWLWSGRRLQPIATKSRNSAAFTPQFTADQWRLIVCYGIFGLGYILPATFLPAMAREQLADPSVFGWVWPVFGLAAAISTVTVSRFFHGLRPRKVWAISALIMTVGVALPVVATGLAALLLSAICVGGTFMVITMSGIQEARVAGGPTLIAAMTASFATGQIVGPLLLNLTAGALLWPNLGAAGLLLLSVFALLPGAPRQS